jgi:CshA-type fibril repeat protein
MKTNIYIFMIFTMAFSNLLLAVDDMAKNTMDTFKTNNMKIMSTTGSVCGHVYNDQNANGKQDRGEKDLARVNVCIKDVTGNEVLVTTDINGDYCLSGVPIGVASVDIHNWTLPVGSVMTGGTTDPTIVTIVANEETFEENNGYQIPMPNPIPSPTPISLILTDDKVVEGEILTFEVNLSRASTIDIILNISTIDGSAVASEDYTQIVQIVTIPAGTVGMTVNVLTNDDKVDEVKIETMTLMISVSSGIDGNPQISATGSIIDNDVFTSADTIRSDVPHVPASVNILANDTNITVPAAISLIPSDNTPTRTITKDTDNDGDVDEIVVPGEGTWSVDSNGTITFSPEAGFTADPTPIKYIVDDNEGQTSEPTTIEADYPQTPTKVKDDNVTGNVGIPTSINVLENDTDNEDDTNISSVNLIAPVDANGTDSNNDGNIDMIIIPSEGVWTVDTNGTVIFTPATTFTGDPTSIGYTVEDNTEETSESAMININILQVLRDDNVTSIVERVVTIEVLKNDDEVNAHSVNLLGPVGASENDVDGDNDIDKITVPGEGIWQVNNDGIVTFTPESHFKSDPSPIRYTARDKKGNLLNLATVRIHYIQIGLLIEPKAVDDTLNIYSYKLHTRNVSENDRAGEGGKAQQVYQLLYANGIAVPVGKTLPLKYGEVSMERSGIYSYRAFANIVGGEDTFRYMMKDTANQTSIANVAISINCASTQLSDNGGIEGMYVWVLFFFMGFVGVYFVRKEKENRFC